jgi:hypothetical protein
MTESTEQVSREDYDRLLKRIEELEKQIAEKDEEEDESNKFSEMGDKFMKESNKVIRGLVDASMEAMSEAASTMSDGGGEIGDKMRDGDVAESMISAYDRFIEIQQKALEKFRERYRS